MQGGAKVGLRLQVPETQNLLLYHHLLAFVLLSIGYIGLWLTEVAFSVNISCDHLTIR